SLVANAWGVFGAAFGPAIMLSLFWKRFNYTGALVGIVVGAVVDIAWFTYLPHLGIYEIIPGFFIGFVAAVIATLCTPAPSQEVEELFDKAVNYQD
ncbi:MAG: sodium:proline symporter, partial [Phascolarctobacterium sp.]|nr:sodium:proline symporter [Phascolarctobacterium sp.]